ncbi:MAG: mechanosensitive ion channel [Nitrosopumilus sp.]|nr:mechanosensitive ion channel [Nitrosopumilus sp.]MDH3488491.1 mechanosensitive ion channel [Nitrosopumilus sp.]
MVEEISQISNSTLIPLNHVLMTDVTLQMSLVFLVAGFIAIFLINRRVSQWVETKKISYARPFATEFVKKALLSLFAIALFISADVYIQIFELFDTQVAIDAANAYETLTPRETFAKILDTIVILVIGYAVVNLIPIFLSKNESKKTEKLDYKEWVRKKGFDDDKDDLFHQLFKWNPPKHKPAEIPKDEYLEKMKSPEGIRYLENFYTSNGVPIGNFKQIKSNTFQIWQQSENEKYAKYFQDCTSGNNESGRVLLLGVHPKEIYTISQWREQKRISNYDPIIPGARPPGWADRQSSETTRSFKQIIPLVGFIGLLVGLAAWWEIDLLVLATASGGLAIGIGFAMQETMQNYFAYLSIKKDKIFVEGDRIQLENGYVGVVGQITPRVTYVRDALNESIAVIPTRQLIAATIINFSKDIKFIPVKVEVGVSYLDDPEEVAAVLIKVGLRAMSELKDKRGNHLIVHEKCPYREEQKPSCGCDANILADIEQPIVRVVNFNSSSVDFVVRVFVKDYDSQFKVKSDIRIMIIKEFKKHNITIPWPIQTEYHGDLDKEIKGIEDTSEVRKQAFKKYGVGDLNSSDESRNK